MPRPLDPTDEFLVQGALFDDEEVTLHCGYCHRDHLVQREYLERHPREVILCPFCNMRGFTPHLEVIDGSPAARSTPSADGDVPDAVPAAPA